MTPSSGARLLLLFALSLWGCSEESPPAPAPEVGQDPEPAAPPVTEPADPAPADVEPSVQPEDPQPEELIAEAMRLADEQRRARARDLFGEVIRPLTEAAEAHQEHDDLDNWSLIGKDKSDNLETINELLDGVIESLGVSELAETRSRLRELEGEIRDLAARLIEDREARLSAPSAEELNRLERVYKMSREEYEARIAEALTGIANREQEIRDLHVRFVEQMRGIGLDIDLEGARSLLSTVTGDDFIEMCVVLDNVRGMTLQLQDLTEESGESLEAARRYYGAYVMLVRLMDRVQKAFITRSIEEMVPKLEELAEAAEDLIEEARDNLDRGGDRAILEQNIRSNELTVAATEFYAEYLRGQAAEIQARNDDLQTTLRDAENTFDTVTLSSQVAAILQEGQRNFAALLRLDLPPLRGFENAELQKEFERLTEQMAGIQ